MNTPTPTSPAASAQTARPLRGADHAVVDGVRCDAGFIDTGNTSNTGDGVLFTVTHRPAGIAGTTTGAVVICPSLFAEEHTDYRRNFQLAQRLAETGTATIRFHYRGVGNSSPDDNQSIDTFADDALRCRAALSAASGVTRVGFVGVGPGALIAATAAAQVPGAPVAFWKPAADGERYLRDLLRARLIAATRTGRTGVTSSEVLDALATEGWASVMGFRLTASLHASLLAGRLVELAPTDPRRVLTQPFKGSRTAAATAALEAWTGAGHSVTTTPTALAEDPWFIPDAAETSGEVAALEHSLVDATCTWFRARWDDQP